MLRIPAPHLPYYNSEIIRKARYVRNAMKDSFLRTFYSELDMPGYSLYERALIDCHFAPNIVSVGWKKYTGKPGDRIPIKVFDDCGLLSVYLSIFDAAGNLVESDYALPIKYEIKWVYTVLKENLAVKGCHIVVTAMDWPENKTVKTFRIY